MTALQKVNLGTAPGGTDGDPVRAAFVKMNSNVDVLGTQAALVTAPAITAAQALTAAAHLGKRVDINLASADTINVPAASTCSVDGVLHIRNLGATVATLAVTTGSGDTISFTKLNAGESVLLETDGVHAWGALMRGRASGDNEIVNGALTVGAALTVAGATKINYTSPALFLNDTGGTGTVAIRLQQAGVYSWIFGTSAANNKTFNFERWSAGSYVDTPLSISNSTGVASFSQRPTFAGNTPWDSGNIPGTSTSGVFNFTSRPTFASNTPWDSGNYKPGCTLLQTKTTQSNSLLSMNGVTGYNVYELTFTDVVASANASNLSMQLSGDNGSTWVAGSADYRYTVSTTRSGASAPVVTSGSANSIALATLLGNSSTGMFCSGTIRFYGFGRSVRAKAIKWEISMVDSNGVLCIVSGVGELQTSTSPLNAVLIAGGFNDGVWSLYGLNN